MLLYIIRHAWTPDRDAARWPNDDERPLTRPGSKRFARFVKRLARRGFDPEVVATSPLVRCRQTADILARHAQGKSSIVELPALAPGSNYDALMHWTSQRAEQRVAWVGHAPDVNELAAQAIAAPKARFSFRKGAVACIELDAEAGQGELVWMATASLLGL